jgi:hypothetical protein
LKTTEHLLLKEGGPERVGDADKKLPANQVLICSKADRTYPQRRLRHVAGDVRCSARDARSQRAQILKRREAE